jgi:hypothetical protein
MPLTIFADVHFKLWIFDVHVVYKQARVLPVEGKHIIMGGDRQPGLQRPGQISSFLVGHIANAVGRQPPGIAAIDGQQDDVQIPSPEFGLQPLENTTVPQVSVKLRNVGAWGKAQAVVA